jgi:hypothetical protein
MCSLIGTVNNTSGFLADENGQRRFLITKLEHIDRKYQKIDVHQAWAQAVALYRDGETGNLTPEESAMQSAINERYEAMNVLSDWLDRSFFFHPDYDTPYSMADIITALVSDGFKPSGSNIGQAMELSRVLRKKHARSDHTREGNRWFGLLLKPRS